jgi:ketosteroid isomerase-like protein
MTGTTAKHPNVEVWEKVHETFTTGDMDRLAPLIAPDVVWQVPGDHLISGTYTVAIRHGAARRRDKTLDQDYAFISKIRDGRSPSCRRRGPKDRHGTNSGLSARASRHGHAMPAPTAMTRTAAWGPRHRSGSRSQSSVLFATRPLGRSFRHDELR